MAPASEIFAPDLLARPRRARDRRRDASGAQAAARAASRCGARVSIAGRRADVLEEAAARSGERLRPSSPATCASPTARPRSSPRRSSATAASTCSSTTPAASTSCPAEDDRRQGLARGVAAERRRDAEDDRGGARRGPSARPGGGTIVNVTLSPHHGMPGMAHSGAARAAVEALTRELAARWAPRGIAVVARGDRPLRRPSRCRSTPRPSARARPARVPLQRLGRARVRLARRAARLAARPRAQRLGRHARRRARQLVRARGRRRALPATTGEVPTEDAAARARPSLRYACGHRRLAGEVLWLHRSLPSFEGGFDSRRPL